MLELNKIYQKDNLELLQEIPSEQVDLIYCDILYNTGKNFSDYNDNLGNPIQAMEWYRPRIQEMKRVLKITGNIVVQCDRNISHYMKVMLDNIFGLKNFVNEIIWKRSNGNSLSSKITTVTDSLLFYKMSNNSTYNQQYHEMDKKWSVEKETQRLYTHAMLENKSNFKYKGEERIINGVIYKTDIGWKWSQDTVDQKLKENPYIFYITKNGKVRYKVYDDETKGRNITNLWDDIQNITSNSKESVGYDTQKPKELLKRIILMTTNEGDVVADFFVGSGTSMVVASEINRRFLGCDINPKAIDLTNERLNKII